MSAKHSNQSVPSVCRAIGMVVALLALPAAAQETMLLWGDTHVHTSNSVDAYSYGNYLADPDTAFRYAKGQPVLHPGTRQRIRIDRPLDFLVVADHAEMLGLQTHLRQRARDWTSKPTAQRLLDTIERGDPRDVFLEVMRIVNGEGGDELLRDYNRPDLRDTAWAEQVAFADQHDEPGRFTAMIGWEWSPGPNGVNLHRVIFTSANAAIARQFRPLSYYDTLRPEELWRWLEQTSARTGAEFVAIPHNSNLSGGKMFDLVDSDGRPLTAEYMRSRIRWEPVMEVTQTKGTSETAPALSPGDPFADHEIRNVLLSGAASQLDDGSYARGALKRGLQLAASTGTNPYRFGMIGSTDTHTGLVSVEEGNHYGKLVQDSLPEQRVKPSRGGFDPWRTSASGLAGVWATANTRAAILQAFRRKEVYATTGPRITVRFFGGFGFSKDDADAADLAAIGYRKGIPMGGDLRAAARGPAPGFLLQVDKDPLGANLDRVQIVKGWMDGQGNTHEKVFDVAWSDDRRIDAVGKLPPLPSTVDVDTARYANTVGSAQLRTYWRDAEFDPTQPAFYYLRAIEIATPRHQVYDAVALGMDPRATGYPVTIQERAYSSPIWYSP